MVRPLTPLGAARVVAVCAASSGVLSVAGILTLIVFFATLDRWWGSVNDAVVALQYLIMIPLALALHRWLEVSDVKVPRPGRVVGLTGMAVVVALQALLVAGILSFSMQIGPVVVGFLMVLFWFLKVAEAGGRTGIPPGGRLLGMLAGLLVGYPVWAFWLALRLGRWRRAGGEAPRVGGYSRMGG